MTGSTHVHTHTHTLTENTCDPLSSVTSASWSPKPILYTEIYFYKLWFVSNVYQIHTQKHAHTHTHTNVHVHGHINPRTLVVSIALILQLICNDNSYHCGWRATVCLLLLGWIQMRTILYQPALSILEPLWLAASCVLNPTKIPRLMAKHRLHTIPVESWYIRVLVWGGNGPLGFEKRTDLCWGY